MDLLQPPELVLPDYYRERKPAIIRPESGFDPVRAAIPFGMFLSGLEPGAAPVVAGTNTGGQGNASSAAVNLPSSIASGNLLLVFITIGRNSATSITTPPSGYTQLYNTIGAGNLRRGACYYKIATGTEGAQVTVGFSQACESAHVTCRITGQTSGYLTASTSTSGTSTSADPGSVTTSWHKDSLWLAAIHNVPSSSTATPPSGYTSLASGSVGSGSTARVTLFSNSGTDQIIDPAAFTMSVNTNWIANTVIVG